MSDWDEIRAYLIAAYRRMSPAELRVSLTPLELRAIEPYLLRVRVEVPEDDEDEPAAESAKNMGARR